MRKQSSVKPAVRFRRWSRKAYAVFVSVKAYVTIGCLRTGTADSSLSKQKGKQAARTKRMETENPYFSRRANDPLEIPISSVPLQALTGGLFLVKVRVSDPGSKERAFVEISKNFPFINNTQRSTPPVKRRCTSFFYRMRCKLK